MYVKLKIVVKKRLQNWFYFIYEDFFGQKIFMIIFQNVFLKEFSVLPPSDLDNIDEQVEYWFQLYLDLEQLLQHWH